VERVASGSPLEGGEKKDGSSTVIPVKTGIQFFTQYCWMPDQVRHDDREFATFITFSLQKELRYFRKNISYRIGRTFPSPPPEVEVLDR